jgi:hypothetical protein
MPSSRTGRIAMCGSFSILRVENPRLRNHFMTLCGWLCGIGGRAVLVALRAASFYLFFIFFFYYLFNSFSGGVHSVLTWTSGVNDSIMTLEVSECGTLTPTKSFPACFGRVVTTHLLWSHQQAYRVGRTGLT